MGRCPNDEPTGKSLVWKKALPISENSWKNLLGGGWHPPPPPPLAIGGLISFKIIAKASRMSGILDTLQAREMLTMKTSYISHVLMLKLKCISRDRSM